MSIEAMKQALEALEKTDKISGYPNKKKAITALRTAIEAAEKQEAWNPNDTAYRPGGLPQDFIEQAEKHEPVEQDAKQWGSRLNDASWAATDAWDRDLMGPMSGAIFNNIKGVIRVAILKYLEGYTTPPAAPVKESLTTQPAAQRQWVGLTEAEINEWDYDTRDVVMDIEKLLREKNT
jgi:hypothetical protein